MKDNKTNDAEEQKDPIWLTTFGDSMSLLLTFFVLLFASTSSDKVEMKEMLGYLRGSLGLMEKTKPSIVSPPVRKLNRRSITEEIKEFISQQGLDNSQVKIDTLPEGTLISLNNPLLFDLGRADLKKETIPLLDKIADILRNIPNEISIEGHTDNVPIHTRRFPSNWELSTARAIAVGDYFIKKGILASRLSVIGYADSRPIFPNDNEEHRALNRRVEILIKKNKSSGKTS